MLQVDAEILSISFEEQFPTGLTGNPPNLDVALQLAGGSVIGIESKSSEWLTPKAASKEPFKVKYFPAATQLWAERELPVSQELAEQMNRGLPGFDISTHLNC